MCSRGPQRRYSPVLNKIGVLPEVSGWAENLDFRKKWRRRRRNWRRWRRMSSREE